MGKFDPSSLSKEQLDEAVRSGRLSDYYFDDDTLIKEISTSSGGYVLKLIVRSSSAEKDHVQMDFIYDSDGRLVDQRLHKF